MRQSIRAAYICSAVMAFISLNAYADGIRGFGVFTGSISVGALVYAITHKWFPLGGYR